MNNPDIILTIGGSDPSGGAGIQADIKTAVKLGLYPCAVITALTVQNSREFSQANGVPPEILSAQLEAVLSDVIPDAVKIGFLPTVDDIEVVRRMIVKYDLQNIVVDPVLTPTLGSGSISREHAIAYFNLFALSTLSTPNRSEKEKLESLSGELFYNVCESYLVTGGDSTEKDCVDTLYTHQEITNQRGTPSSAFPTLNFNHSSLFHLTDSSLQEESMDIILEEKQYSHKRISTTNTHGSGCVLSTAIACYLAQGKPLEKAVEAGTRFLQDALHDSSTTKIFKGTYGPALI